MPGKLLMSASIKPAVPSWTYTFYLAVHIITNVIRWQDD